jgi:hypothetical protein
MHGNEQAFLESIAGPLGAYYLFASAINAVAAFLVWQRFGKPREAIMWLPVALLFLLMAPCAMSGGGWMMNLVSMPESIKEAVDAFSRAETFTGGSLVMLIILFLGRRFFVKPAVAWGMLNVALLVMGLSVTDADFAAIVTKPDNVPIVGLLFVLGFFTWLATAKAVANDDRHLRGEPPVEKMENEKLLVWPDLVYTELICMIALTAFLIIWAIALQAPLEEPASSVNTPNPSKAPWYFLGLQEMLVYFDPWMAGVVLPSMVVVGLMAIPFLDFNKSGNGYYTIDERKFSYAVFQIGFIEMWVVLIILGTFLRGPNWNFFGPYETWDAHKVDALNNVDLAQYFWIDLCGKSLPKATQDVGFFGTLWTIVTRECAGIVLTVVYFALLPPLMAATVFRKFFIRMGFIRYIVMANLLLTMGLLPIKMILRWTCNLKYIVAIPEWFLNF